MGKKLLLIWEQVPESTDCYLIDSELHSDAWDWALQCMNIFINEDDINPDHPIYKLSNWLCTYDTEGNKISEQPKLDITNPLYGTFDVVVICGWFM